MLQGEKDSSEFLKIKMAATEPQPGNFILSVACPIVRLRIYVGPSCAHGLRSWKGLKPQYNWQGTQINFL